MTYELEDSSADKSPWFQAWKTYIQLLELTDGKKEPTPANCL